MEGTYQEKDKSAWTCYKLPLSGELANAVSLRGFRPPKCSAAVFLYDPSRENALPGRPQSARKRAIKNNFSAEYAQSATTTTAASGGNREELLGQRPARRKYRSRHDADAGCRNPIAEGIQNHLTAIEATAHKKCATASFLREERNPMTQTRPLKTNLFNRNADLLHGPIFKNLLLFMLPILVSNLFQQLYNTVDTMIVGNVLGDTALAAIGSCGSIYELLVGFGIGIGNGLSIVAARSYGAQDEDLLKRTVAGSLVIGLCASFVITTAGFFGLRPLLQLLDTPAEILEDAYRYISVIDLGVLVMFLYNLCAGLLRAIGNSVMPLVFLLISSGLNVALDLWFIAGLGMGVQGAAVATVIAQGISVVLCILYVMRRVPLLLPARKHWAAGQHLYWELFSQSISMGLMSSIVSAGSVVLQYGINGRGTLTIAGHTAARKLFSFTSMPLISMANAGSTFVSQNRGAAQPERVRKGMRTMYLCSVVIMAAEVVLMQLFARQLVQLISGSSAPLVLENGARYLMWNAPFYAVLGVLLCTRYALQSLGQKVLPLFSSVIELVGKVIFVLVFIPRYAYNAVILCEPIIWCFMAAYLVAVYRRDAFVYPRKKTI